MSFARTAYEVATSAAQPLLPLIVRRRLKAGKEVAGREGERYGRAQIKRPEGKLIWMHGASMGETRLLLDTAWHLMARKEGLNFLFTCQTATAAAQIEKAITGPRGFEGATLHQFAPIDTPAIAKRFVEHWSPDLAVFAEGEIWPNLLKQLRSRNIPTALINARMTEKSISGWSRWPGLSRDLFGQFDVLLAADTRTANGLGTLSGRPVSSPGNLKSAQFKPGHDPAEAQSLAEHFVGDRRCLVAISTHEGEEDLVLDARAEIHPQPACIIVPRHPERAPAIRDLIEARGLSVSRRSLGEPFNAGTDILLADTLGEVGLFTQLADTVYLGGGHAPGVGGHNPLEILRLGKPLATGPDVFNFEDMRRDLEGKDGYTVTPTAHDLAIGFPFPPPSDELIAQLEAKANAPMDATIDALLPLLQKEART